jgi:hypothetical protein
VLVTLSLGAGVVARGEGLSTFVDAYGGYEFLYPSSWSLRDHSAGTGLIRADVTRGRDLGVQVRLVRGPGAPFAAYVTRYQEKFTRDMAGHWKGAFGDVSRDCGTVGVHEGCRLREVFRRGDGESWLFLQYLWPSGRDVIVFECGSRIGAGETNEPQLDAIAESLRLRGH